MVTKRFADPDSPYGGVGASDGFHVDKSMLAEAAMELRDLLPVAMAEASLPSAMKKAKTKTKVKTKTKHLPTTHGGWGGRRANNNFLF